MRKKKFAGVGRIISYGSLSLLGLFAFALLFPIARSDSYATCTPDSSAEECMAMPASTEVGVTTSTVISLALDNQVQMEVVPKSSGTTSYASTKLNVSTNSNDGYAIYLQTGSETGSLTGVTTNLMGEISNTAKNNVTLDKLGSNSYGYALSKTEVGSNTTYSHIPTSSTIVESTTGSMASGGGEYAYGDTYYLAFGTKIDTNLPAGQYAGTVTVSAVANPTTLRSMYDLTYMQDMTSDICTNTKEHYTKQLIDTRDGKSYWVAKLKDGNCWMVQNLALDITEEGLKAVDTDIEEDWNQESEYPPSNTNRVKLNGTIPALEDGSTDSWNFGLAVQAIPTLLKKCSELDSVDISIMSDQKIGEVCESSGFIDIDDTWDSVFTGRHGEWTFEDGTIYEGYVTADKIAKAYDAHYLVGNYYMYNAAAAGTGSIMEEGKAKGSICPKNWTLPFQQSEVAGAVGTFESLLEQYGFERASINDGSIGVVSRPAVEKLLTLVKSPLYYVMSGSVYRWSGAAIGIGTSAGLWNNMTKQSEGYIAPLSLNISLTGNFIWYNRSDRQLSVSGNNVRCLVK